MNERIPLGQLETEHLEFKSRAILRNLSSVSREVVAMLNASGGELWIGVAEQEGRAAAVESIESVEREIGRIRDYLADSIEPSPRGEVHVEPVHSERKQDEVVIRIKITPSSRGLYNFREGTGRHFLIRVADRVRPMSHQEILSRLTNDTQKRESDFQLAKDRIKTAREQHRIKHSGLWLRIEPITPLGLASLQDLRNYLINPWLTHNRDAGWNFVNSYQPARIGPGRISQGKPDETYTTIYTSGAIQFSTPMTSLYWKTVTAPSQNATEIWPYCVLEYPISVFRLASAIFNKCTPGTGQETNLLVDVALFGVEGWTLRPYSPKSIGYRLDEGRSPEAKDLEWGDPLEFGWEEIVDSPDRCGFRLVSRVYEGFDLTEDEIPMEFDRESGKLILS